MSTTTVRMMPLAQMQEDAARRYQYYVVTHRLAIGPLRSKAAACGLADLIINHRHAYAHPPEILNERQYLAALADGACVEAQPLVFWLEKSRMSLMMVSNDSALE